MSSTKLTDDDSSVRFIVTGFGPFGGVPDNPTTVLAHGLVEYLSTIDKDPGSFFPLLASKTKTLVLETSAKGARDEIDKLYREEQQESQQATNSKVRVVLLHLGVNYGATDFKLETCAYNDASFDIPDERGFRPNYTSILGDDYQIGMPLKTLLNVPALVTELNDVLADCKIGTCETPAAISTNPGRFVCNYTYCYSLDKFKCNETVTMENGSSVRCLFVHVPPFERVPKDDQFWFVAQLMKTVYQRIHACNT